MSEYEDFMSAVEKVLAVELLYYKPAKCRKLKYNESFAENVSSIIAKYINDKIVNNKTALSERKLFYNRAITLFVIALNNAIQTKMNAIPAYKEKKRNKKSNNQETVTPSHEKSCGMQLNEDSRNIGEYNDKLELYYDREFKNANKEFTSLYKDIIKKINVKTGSQKVTNAEHFNKAVKDIGKILIDESFSTVYIDPDSEDEEVEENAPINKILNPWYRIWEKIHDYVTHEQGIKNSNTLIKEPSDSILEYYNMFYELLEAFKNLSNNLDDIDISDYEKLKSAVDSDTEKHIECAFKIWNNLHFGFYHSLLYTQESTSSIYIRLKELFPTDEIFSDEAIYLFNKKMIKGELIKRRLRVAGSKIYYYKDYNDKYSQNFKKLINIVLRVDVLKKKSRANANTPLANVKNEESIYFSAKEINDIWNVKENVKTVCKRISDSHCTSPNVFEDRENKVEEQQKKYNNNKLVQTIPGKARVVEWALGLYATVEELEVILKAVGRLLSDSIVMDRYIRLYFEKAEKNPSMYNVDIWNEEYLKIGGTVDDQYYLKNSASETDGYEIDGADEEAASDKKESEEQGQMQN